MTPRGSYLPESATSEAQTTRHGPRPGLAFAPRCTHGLPVFHAAYSAREDPRPDEKSKVFRGKVN